MTTETFVFEYTAGADIYFRLFNAAGQVFDFSDNTFKALSAATTPYFVATEKADMGGTTQSGYVANIDLADVHNTGAVGRFVLKAYDNDTPADTDDPISDPLPITVQFGELGEGELLCQFELNVKSTEGLAAQLSVWLERNGKKIDIDTVDPSCSCSVTVREHGSGANLFTAAGVVGDLQNDRFEFEQATPGFTDDRQYDVTVSITENGNTHSTTHSSVVIG